MTGAVLLLGSGPDVTRCRGWDLGGFNAVVAINNAWQVRPDWTHAIHPDDFPQDRRPVAAQGQRMVRSETYVPSQNRFGGVVYAGGTMAFTAAYWVLDALAPRIIAFLGCDMVYSASGKTHFYGTGTADPLRADPTLQSLEAKARRFQALAAREGTAVVNLSEGESRLPYRRATYQALDGLSAEGGDAVRVDAALERERLCDIRVPSGRYWEEPTRVDPALLAEIDALWLGAFADQAASAAT